LHFFGFQAEGWAENPAEKTIAFSCFLDENTKIPPFLRQERRITVENLPPVQEITGAVL
jgi:hypothetical protein